ncbi:FAD-dependent oxidoreductase [Streptomyces sp. HUAS MG47]|uniref:FAD-dependent oxidoreductase n=1 Tax=Streptomyces solicamelliae TaxID=3231716 RepID=UPI003877F75B
MTGPIVVVGNGMAAHRLVERLAAHGHHGPVTVLGAEPRPAYRRPLLPWVLAGSLPGDALELPAHPDGVTVRTGVRVTGIDRGARTVTCADGSVVPYRTLVLATGARHALHGGVAPARGRVAVVGGGVLGVETAAALRRRGHDVLLAHAGPYPMHRVLDEAAGGLVAAYLTGLGVELRCDTRVGAGDTLGADTVVRCTGGVPETALARAAGLPVRRGVVVDGFLRTADPAIHAVGSCVDGTDGLLATASAQAEYLAARLTGRTDAPYTAPPTLLRPRLPGLDVAVLGRPDGDGSHRPGTPGATADERHAPGSPDGPAIPDETDGKAGRLRQPDGSEAPRAPGATGGPRTSHASDVRARGTHRPAVPGAPDLPATPAAPPVPDEVVTFADPAGGRHARLELSGGRLRYAVLVGLPEAIAAAGQLYDRGLPVPADRLALLLGSSPAPDDDPDAWPEAHVVCHCNNVTKADVAHAWQTGARTPDALATATRATTGCGGCGDKLRALCGVLKEPAPLPRLETVR